MFATMMNDGAEQHRPLDRRQVGVDDRVVGEPADARDVEHRLRQDGAAEEDADVEPRHRHDRRERGAEAVPEDHAPLAQALRAGGADVVLAEDLDQVPAHHARVERGERGREDEPGQDQRREPAARALRERHVAAGPAEEVHLPDVRGEQEEGSSPSQ